MAKIQGIARPGAKLMFLVSILGISAYLLFTQESTDPQKVSARQRESTAAPISTSQPTSSAHTDVARPDSAPASATQPVSTVELVSSVPALLENASTAQRATADQLLQFSATGNMADIRDLTREEIQSLVELLASELGIESLASLLETRLGLPAASFLAYDNPADALADLFEAVQTETNATPPAGMVFSDRVEADGRVTGSVHVIPAGTKRVYAAFENAGSLQGLDRVLAVWRDPSDDRMVFTEYEPIRVGAVYNYVWLDLDDGWQAGFYKLDLFHPSRTSELLASRSFNVR